MHMTFDTTTTLPRKVKRAKKEAERKQSSGSRRTMRYSGMVLVLLHQCPKDVESRVSFPTLLINKGLMVILPFPPGSILGYGQMTGGKENPTSTSSSSFSY